MTRYWAMAALAFVAFTATLTQAGGEKAKDKDFQFQGKLTKDDPKDLQRGGPSRVHIVPMKAGKVYTIDMVSTEFDSYLRVQDPQGMQLEEDDDSGGNLNSRILFNCPKDGDYKLLCTTFGPNASGQYTLTVKTSGAAQPPSTAHTRLIGQNAPDFEGDFAINGKPGKLSDLQGKAVLLDFSDVRSRSSVALLPRLEDWHKTYRAKGLEIVSVTYYLSDIGQPLAFDPESGTVKTTAQADRKSDQALLSAFAKHHKVAHRVMALSKQDALDVYSSYAVNGVPQLVLIDRKGVIRLIDVNGDKNSALVETEIKKLLAAK